MSDPTTSPRRYAIRVTSEPVPQTRSRKKALLNHVDMKEAGLETGALVILSQNLSIESVPFAVAVAWPSSDVERGGEVTIDLVSPIVCTIASTSDFILVTPIHRLHLKSREASKLVLADISASKSHSDGAKASERWAQLCLRETLVDTQNITQHQIVQVIFRKELRTYTFVSAEADSSLSADMSSLSFNETTHPQTIWKVGWNTDIIIKPPEAPKRPTTQIDADALHGLVGGLKKQIDSLRELLDLPLSRPELFERYGLKPPRGILLFGPPGTGKTHLARSLASASGVFLLTVSGPELSSAYHGETESKLRAIFDEARARSPCIVVLDEIDALCPKREDGGALVEARVVTTLLTLMDGMDAADAPGGGNMTRVVVIATTNRPNAIDPALRRPGRFDRELEIGVPDATGRLSILEVLLSKFPHNLTPEQLQSLASKTHGFVGADLSAAVRDAGTLALRRHLLNPSSDHKAEPCLTLNDLHGSISGIRPSALREHFIEAPKVRWSDIGGQEVIKQKLRECVEWPLLYPETFERLGIAPPRGVLLYGPPGCSKTLTARALATESGINFISVKGPELLNKYVGESERSVRDIFRKARAASPSIVFFDEIDALATSRESGEGNSQGVLTSLLTEMDGLQDLVGVIVVAATNRPDVLDSALMRPGRLDRILYVGPPDLSGRKDILRIQTHKMSVDSDVDLEYLAHVTEGCSGAEIVAMCQDAALHAMKADLNAKYVTHADFVNAAGNIRRQITPAVVAGFISWRDASGLSQA